MASIPYHTHSRVTYTLPIPYEISLLHTCTKLSGHCNGKYKLISSPSSNNVYLHLFLPNLRISRYLSHFLTTHRYIVGLRETAYPISMYSWMYDYNGACFLSVALPASLLFSSRWQPQFSRLYPPLQLFSQMNTRNIDNLVSVTRIHVSCLQGRNLLYSMARNQLRILPLSYPLVYVTALFKIH